MLRWIVLALLLANAGFWAWRQGWLEPLHGVIGARPEGEREPQRLGLQVRPEAIELMPAEAPAPRPLPASAATAPGTVEAVVAVAALECLEAGPFNVTEFALVEASVKSALPGGAWAVREIAAPWWVVMGPFVDTELLQKKRDELRRRGITPQQLPTASGAPLLVLSRHAARPAAELELTALVERGVHTARTMVGGPALRVLRVAQADALQQSALAALGPDRLRGKPFGPCPPAGL